MSLSKSKIFLILCLAFILGVLAGRFINYVIMACGAMIFVVMGTIGYRNKVALLIGIAGLVTLAGALRFQTTFQQNDLSPFYGQQVMGQAVIVEEPDVRSDKVYLTLGKIVINNQQLSSRILATVPLFPEYQYGQKLDFSGKLQEPKEFPDFSYKNYLSRFGIDAVVYYPKVSVMDGDFGNRIKSILLNVKKSFVNNLNRELPEPQAAFMGGLILGAKRAIPQSLIDQFNTTGTSHIIALSGYNISVIAIGLASLLEWFGARKRISFAISILAIIGFVIMAGASASVVRAGIMGLLVLLARNIGRLYAIGNALVLSAVVMLAINPQILHFDVGFQLSFAAVLGLIYCTPMIEKYFTWVPAFFREYLLATLSAQVFTLPLLLSYFGRLSLVAIPVNILVLIPVPMTMLFGFLTGLAGFLGSIPAWAFMAISWLLLTYIIKVVDLAASIPFASVGFNINIYLVILYYIILVTILILYYKLWKPRLSNSSNI